MQSAGSTWTKSRDTKLRPCKKLSYGWKHTNQRVKVSLSRGRANKTKKASHENTYRGRRFAAQLVVVGLDQHNNLHVDKQRLYVVGWSGDGHSREGQKAGVDRQSCRNVPLRLKNPFPVVAPPYPNVRSFRQRYSAEQEHRRGNDRGANPPSVINVTAERTGVQ